MTGGGTQWANQTRSAGSTTTAASSAASRAAAAAAVVNSSIWPSALATVSSSSIRPPGNTHIPPKAIFEFLWSMRASSPVSVSRRTTTVAAGMSSESPYSSWFRA